MILNYTVITSFTISLGCASIAIFHKLLARVTF